MAFPLINPSHQFFDSTGAPLVSGTVEFRDPTSNALINTYPTADDADAQTNANDNPFTLDARGGFAGIYLEDGVKYKMILKDAAGGTVDTQDDILCPRDLSYLDTTSAETLGSVTPVDKSYDAGNVLRYGENTSPGTTVMTSAFQAAINQAVQNGGSPVYVPAGEYLIDASLQVTLTGASDHERIQIYGDGWKSIITSTVIGEPTLEVINGTAVHVHDLNFQGNSLTGASGNGHAIAFTDTTPNSGTFNPQHCSVKRCLIQGFRGNDVEITTTTTGVTTVAAAVYMGPGIANFVERVVISDCGTGIHFDECQNSHVNKCVMSLCDNWGIEFDIVNDGCSINQCDIISCGLDGNGDPTVWSGAMNYAGILARSINPIAITQCKFKLGQAITVFASEGTVIRDNYFRCDAPDTVAHTWAIQADTFGSITIDGNEFEYQAGTGSAISSAIDLDSQSSRPSTCNVENNTFNHAEFGTGGFDVRYKGASTANSNFTINHKGNTHGSPLNGRTNSVVTDCIVLDTLNWHGEISGNTFMVTGDGVSAGGTITDCIDISAAAGAASNSGRIFGNKSRVYLTGGTITNAVEEFQASSFTGTLTGCTTSPTGSIEFSVDGDIVTLEIPAITGTSNTTAATVTGMPSYIQPTATQQVYAVTQDNSAEVQSRVSIATSGVITLHNALSATFTGSGTKGISAQTIQYRKR